MIIAAFTAATVRKGSVCVLRQLPVRGTFHLGTQHSSISEKKEKMIEKQKTKVENLKEKNQTFSNREILARGGVGKSGTMSVGNVIL